MATITYPVSINSETNKFAIEIPRGTLSAGSLYGYQWTVTDETGKNRTLSGITRQIRRRLSTYLREFSKPIDDNSSELHRLASQLKNKTIVKIYGPYDGSQNPKKLEQDLIKSVPKRERLNKTSGGNGGHAWSQYEDPTPTVSSFSPDTPTKWYPIEVNEKEIIVPKLTPSMRGVGGVYIIEHQEKRRRYIGQSVEVGKRTSVHTANANHHPEKSKVAQAIANSPESHHIGILPSTICLTARSRKVAEVYHIAEQGLKYSLYNGDKGGTGPAPSKDRPSKRKLDF